MCLHLLTTYCLKLSEGKQLGFDGERSVLFFDIIRLARATNVPYLFLENVLTLIIPLRMPMGIHGGCL
jgi:hypothetical protein